MSPAGLKTGIVNSLVKASPEVLFLAFGRRSLLSSTPMWQSILYPPIFAKILDMSLSFLFHWSGRNIRWEQKVGRPRALYCIHTDGLLASRLSSSILIYEHQECCTLVSDNSQQKFPDVR